jgi:tRNA/tmRNA/rRNA uracil-C5-methylase (TrmA/RlmC/RlmD family)
LKAAVVAEQLQRFAGIDWAVVVEELPGSPDGLHWRTRVRLAVDGEGRPGFRRHRSHEVVATPDCPIVHPAVTATGVLGSDWTGAKEISIAAPADGGPAAIRVDRRRIGATRVTEHVSGRPFRVSGDGFWQVHPAAAQTLTDVVTGMVRPGPGERIADLYAGVGVFAAPLAEAVGTSGEVVMVEESVEACRDARRNLHDLPQAQIIQARVQRWLDDLGDGAGRFDAVVLDPPRAGAGAAVINGLDRLLGPAGRLCYVACDPAALGRDLADLGRRGWQLEDLRAFDAFPMTHHVECIAGLRRT